MVPINEPVQGRLDAKPILIICGKHDVLVPLANAQRLATILKDAGADLDHQYLPDWTPAEGAEYRRRETLVSSPTLQ
jgi:predicted esterase